LGLFRRHSLRIARRFFGACSSNVVRGLLRAALAGLFARCRHPLSRRETVLLEHGAGLVSGRVGVEEVIAILLRTQKAHGHELLDALVVGHEGAAEPGGFD
jgi:hypothetical protein